MGLKTTFIHSCSASSFSLVPQEVPTGRRFGRCQSVSHPRRPGQCSVGRLPSQHMVLQSSLLALVLVLREDLQILYSMCLQLTIPLAWGLTIGITTGRMLRSRAEKTCCGCTRMVKTSSV